MLGPFGKVVEVKTLEITGKDIARAFLLLQRQEVIFSLYACRR